MTDYRIRRLAEELSEVKKIALAQNLPQLAQSSIEDGAINAYDADGNLRAVVGKQHDDTHAVAVFNGPPPPAPLTVRADGGQQVVTVSWAGDFKDAVAPMDFARVEIHLSTTPGFTVEPAPGSATRVGSIESASGGSVTVAAPQGDVYVRLLTRAQTGKVSDVTEELRATVQGAVDLGMFTKLQNDLKASGERVDARMAEIATMPIDGARIDEGSIYAPKLNAQSVGAAVAAFVQLDVSQLYASNAAISSAVIDKLFTQTFAAHKITADELNVSRVAAAVLSTENAEIGARLWIKPGGSLVAGDTTRSFTVWDDKGLRSVLVLEDGRQIAISSIGQGTENALATTNTAGDLTSSVTPDGDASYATVTSLGDGSFAGRPLLGKRFDPEADDGILDDGPRGLVEGGLGDFRSLLGGNEISGQEATLGVLTFTADPGRMYELTMPFGYYAKSVASGKLGSCGIRVRYTYGDDPADPTSSSPVLVQSMASYAADTSVAQVVTAAGLLDSPVTTPGSSVKLLLTAQGLDCSMTFSLADASMWKLWVRDIGPSVQSTARVAASLPSQTTQTGGSTTGTVTPKKTYTATWLATESKEYLADGSQTPQRLPGGYLRHGNAGGGNLRSALAFNASSIDGEKKKMASALAGATITKAEVYIKFKMWYYSSGGTAVLHPLNASSTPSILSSIASAITRKRYTTANQGFWIPVPTSWFSTSARGVVVGPASDSTFSNYGYYYPHTDATVANRPKVRLTYTR